MSYFSIPFIPAFSLLGTVAPGARMFFYVTGTTTPASIYADAALTTPLANPVIANSAGRFVDIFIDDGTVYRVRMETALGALIDEVDPFSSPLGFNNGSAYPDGTVSASLRARGAVVTDAPYNADPTGSANATAAFNAAIATGHAIVPEGTYKLDSIPAWSGSVIWDIHPEAIFTGAGTGFQKFPYMATNGSQLAVGPFIQSRSSQKSAHSNGGIAAWQAEMIQPTDYGAGQSVAIYGGAMSANPDPAGNVWASNFLVYALSGAGGIYHGIEVDVNSDSASAECNGIQITGGGSADVGSAINVTRLSGSKWAIGFYAANVQDGVVLRPVVGGRGIVVHKDGADVAPVTNCTFSGHQLANNTDTIFLQRNTNTSPTGQFIRAVNADNSANIFVVSVAGDITGRSLVTSDRVTMNTATLTGYAYLNFANDAAASAGGVPLGGLYHNAGAARVRIV